MRAPASFVSWKSVAWGATFACVAGWSRLPARPAVTPLNEPRVGQRAEYRVAGVPAVANPFDPDQIRVDATFTGPAGHGVTVPAFWYQAYTRARVEGAEVLAAAGAPEWRIRFTPTEPGAWTLAVDVRVGGAAAPVSSPAEVQFHVPPAADAAPGGRVRVTPDHRGLENANGRPLRLVGENVCWAANGGTYDYDRWFGSMHAAGENFARLWMSPWWAGIEHAPGTLNHYDLRSAWELDAIFQLAERDGIYLLFCLDHHGMYQTDNRNWGGSNNYWRENPYSRANGGPCARPNDFFTSAAARTIYEKRLRYLIGRYGYSPDLLAWEFFNEIDNVIGPGRLDANDVIAWHRAVGDWLRAHDPYHHLITTSLTGGSDRPDVWTVPELDFASYHSYGDAAVIRGLPALARSFVRRYRKPVLIGEFGVDARSWDLAADPYLRGFRQALWGGALGGTVGSAMPWWWEEMDQDDVYPLFAAMTSILRRAGWYEGAWAAVAFGGDGDPPTKLGGALPNGDAFDADLALAGSWRSRPDNECAIANPLAAQRSAEHLAAFLQGRAHPEWQRPIRLTAWFADRARAVVHVNSVAPGGANLVVRVDGDEAARAAIPDRDGSGDINNEINRDYSTAIPPGRHVIEIANTGADWVYLDSVRLERVRPAAYDRNWSYGPEAVGLRNGSKAVLYVCSPWVVYPAGAHRYNPPILARAAVVLKDWPSGRTVAQWIDPRTGVFVGSTEATTADGALALPLPAFRDDLAGIVTQTAVP